MQKVVLQVPVDRKLKDSAEMAAEKRGFSSLQEIVRVFMKRLADDRIDVSFEETIRLSPKAEKRYLKITKDFEKGKNIYTAKDVDDLMRQLHERPLS